MLVDPLLAHSSLHQYDSVTIFDKVKRFNTLSVWFNVFIPLLVLVIVGFSLKWKYDRKKELHDEYVPASI